MHLWMIVSRFLEILSIVMTMVCIHRMQTHDYSRQFTMVENLEASRWALRCN